MQRLCKVLVLIDLLTIPLTCKCSNFVLQNSTNVRVWLKRIVTLLFKHNTANLLRLTKIKTTSLISSSTWLFYLITTMLKWTLTLIKANQSSKHVDTGTLKWLETFNRKFNL